MPKKIFSIKFTSYHFEKTDNLSISIDFNERDLITNVNNLLEPKHLKYKEGTPLNYFYREGVLTVSGIAESFNPNNPDFIFI